MKVKSKDRKKKDGARTTTTTEKDTVDALLTIKYMDMEDIIF